MIDRKLLRDAEAALKFLDSIEQSPASANAQAVVRALVDRLLALAHAPNKAEADNLDWGRIEAGDLPYLGGVFFSAWYERIEKPDQFAMLCGIVTAALCKAKSER